MFLNYAADELPVHRHLGIPACPNCQTNYGLLNYLIWPKKCDTCGYRRSTRTWTVAIFMGIAGLLMLEYGPPDLGWVGGLILLGFLILVTVIDIEHRLILHITSLVGGLMALAIGTILHGIVPTLIGGAVGFGVMLLLYYLGILFMRLSKKLRSEQVAEDEAIGFGDVNLSGVIGLILGWPGISLGLILAVLIAGLISLIYLVWNLTRKKYKPDLAVPYGPFLTLSAFLLLYIRPFFMK